MPTPARYLTSMHDPGLDRVFALPGKARIFGVGRDICLLAVAAVLYLNYHFAQVQVEIYALPSLIFFVR
jgi:hypothetical protein